MQPFLRIPMAHPDVERARKLCWDVHGRQMDRDGHPHAEHCEWVAKQFPQKLVKQVALLHDILEDSDEITYLHLLEQFGPLVADPVLFITRKKTEGWWQYIDRVKRDPVARLVKIADIQHNLRRGGVRSQEKENRYRVTLRILHTSQPSPW